MNNVATVERMPPLTEASAPVTPMELLSRALERGADVGTLEKLMALQERWEGHQARKAFDAAIAEAKAEIPVIAKNRTVSYGTGNATSYKHEDLGELAKTVTPILAKHGLSFRFGTTTADKMVSVTCIISHRDGHFVENTLTAGADTSGSKNAIQAIGSAITYLQRYTLKAALGLAASSDDDGNTAAQTPTIDAEQLETIRAKLDATKTLLGPFLDMVGVEHLEDMPARRFEYFDRLLEAKAKKKASTRETPQ